MKYSLALALLLASVASHCSELKTIDLQNENVVVRVSPQMGGRLLEFALHEHASIIKVGDEVFSNPQPEVTAQSDNIGYMGHIVWLSPQSQWWRQQTINKSRFENAAAWPPDPFLVQASNTVLKNNKRLIHLLGPASPVSGVRIEKTFELMAAQPHGLNLGAIATNMGESTVSWGLWFNTRLEADAKVYVPVLNEKDIRMWDTKPEESPLSFSVVDGILALHSPPPEKGKTRRNGKLFIKPSAGWMAAFDEKQLIIIQFDLQPHVAIHPEQAQVELYMDYQKQALEEGLIEMELHSPYTEMPPGASIESGQQWLLLPYQGKNSDKARRAFLVKTIESLNR
ncbi:protein of unknown function [Alteromonadaceae bacterium Bs31]|nr:protein of unknown function [Alteromonadaceae bacterium Bs31]